MNKNNETTTEIVNELEQIDSSLMQLIQAIKAQTEVLKDLVDVVHKLSR